MANEENRRSQMPMLATVREEATNWAQSKIRSGRMAGYRTTSQGKPHSEVTHLARYSVIANRPRQFSNPSSQYLLCGRLVIFSPATGGQSGECGGLCTKPVQCSRYGISPLAKLSVPCHRNVLSTKSSKRTPSELAST